MFNCQNQIDPMHTVTASVGMPTSTMHGPQESWSKLIEKSDARSRKEERMEEQEVSLSQDLHIMHP